MRGHELLDKMALVEAKYLAEAEALPLPRQRRRTKWILPAAAACLAAALGLGLCGVNVIWILLAGGAIGACTALWGGKRHAD